MRSGIKIILFAAVALVGVFLVSDYIMTEWHEAAHKQIYKQAGYDSEIEIYLSPSGFSGTTTRTAKLRNNTQLGDVIFLAQAMNESIGYHFFGFLTGMYFLAFVVFSLFITYSEAKR